MCQLHSYDCSHICCGQAWYLTVLTQTMLSCTQFSKSAKHHENSLLHHVKFLSFFFLEDINSFCEANDTPVYWYPCLGLLMTSALGFKARLNPSLAYFIAYMQWIFQIHLWCDTYWLLGGQYGSWVVFDPHVFVILHQISELSINAMFPRCLWILTTGCKTR